MQTRREMLRAVGLAAAGVGTVGLLNGSGQRVVEYGGLVRAATDRARPVRDDRVGVVAKLQDFGADLFALLAAKPGNVACSPYSVALALAMTRDGARGTTATELDRVLHSPSLAQLNSGMNSLQQQLATRSGAYQRGDASPAEVTLATASSLWGERTEPWQAPFLADLARNYGAGMHTVDYRSNPQGARHDINGWTSEHTHGRIPELVPADAVDPGTRLVLVNALYFKAPWLMPFETSQTSTAPFTRPDGSRVPVPMMRAFLERVEYTSGPDWQAVRLRYLGGKLAMTLVVPDPGRLESVQRGFSGPMLGQVLGMNDVVGLDLRLPRWTYRFQVDLVDALGALGMPTAFTDSADFTGMTTADRLHIAHVLHQAYVAVDEEGTEASAATAVVMGDTTMARTEQLTVDRPFLYVIHDVETATPLFLGRVTDPAAA